MFVSVSGCGFFGFGSESESEKKRMPDYPAPVASSTISLPQVSERPGEPPVSALPVIPKPDWWAFVGVELPRDVLADRILILKKERQMVLFSDGKPLKTYQIALGYAPEGPKRYEGDGKTPEGVYHISYKNPNSSFHLSLKISYPNAEDKARARALGRPPGGDIMIHGLPNRDRRSVEQHHPNWDWTWGCIAVNNEEIEELWRAVPVGTKIEIRP